MTEATIFVSIAAYREFDLPATLRSALDMADAPSRLHICVCWQRDEAETLDGLENHPQLRLIEVPYAQSRGVCWARNLIQQHYSGERYYLQLDAHHRFVPGWDTQLIDMLEDLRGDGVAKPVLTTYLPAFDPANDPDGRSEEAWLLGMDRFDDSGVVFMRPYIAPPGLEKPAPTRFWSAHFSFSDGDFVKEVPIDPNGYFHGEEIGTCVRAWTSGYDFFSPHRVLLWHEYTRKGRRCHWDDHSDWTTRNTAALSRYKCLVGLDGRPRVDFAGYGLGSARSLQQYEDFAGLRFADRWVSEATLAHEPPPAPPLPGENAGDDSVSAAATARPEAAAIPDDCIPKRNTAWEEEQLDGELVLYNEESTMACYLNESAAIVWQLIDGQRSIAEITGLLQEAYPDAEGIGQDVTEAVYYLVENRAAVF